MLSRANNDQIRVIRREKYISIPIDGFLAIFANHQGLESKPVTGGWAFGVPVYAGIDLYCLSLGLLGLRGAFSAMKKARRMAGWRPDGR
jgi:hypothetical protein